jgi:hypothetical protein
MATGLTTFPDTLQPSASWPISPSGQGAINATPQRRISLWPSDVASLVAIAILALGFVSPYAATRLQILLTVILVLHRSPLWLPALILMQFTPTDFKGGYGAAMDVQYERFEGLTIYVFGFPLTPNFTLVLSMVARAVYDIATYPGRFRRVLAGWLLVPIAVAVLVSAYNSIFLGLFEKIPGWSAPLRTSLTSLAIWYGASLAYDWEHFRHVMLRRVVWISAGFFGVTFFRPLVNSQYCFLIPFGVSCAVAFLVSTDIKGLLKRPLGAGILAMSGLNYLFGARVSDVVKEAAKKTGGGVVVQTTHAVMAALPALLMIARTRIVSPSNVRLARTVTLPLFALYVALPFLVALLSRGVDVDVRSNTAVTFYERAVYKLFFERSSIWRGKMDLISQPPFVFVPPSRESKWITASGNEMRFRASAHNMVLEYLSSEGLLSGSVNLLILYVAFSAAVFVWLVRRDSFCGILATTFLVGMMWDGFGIAHCIEGAAAFLLYSTAGACCVAAAPSFSGSRCAT